VKASRALSLHFIGSVETISHDIAGDACTPREMIVITWHIHSSGRALQVSTYISSEYSYIEHVDRIWNLYLAFIVRLCLKEQVFEKLMIHQQEAIFGKNKVTSYIETSRNTDLLDYQRP